MKSSRLSQLCDGLLEAGWLLGVIITPVFFNVFSDRVFEPDKLTTLRALTVFMSVVWLVRFVELTALGEKPLRFSWRTPLVLPALLTMLVYLISSLFSLVPYTSFIGSYQRLQGTFSLSAYLVLFFSIVTVLKTRTQLDRLITTMIVASIPVALYGIVQHAGGDPLPWAGDVRTRVASNMGNSIFVGAYLIMVVPLTLSRIVGSFRDIMSRPEGRLTDILRASAYIFVFSVQLLTIWYSQSRGPWLGIIAALFIFVYLALLVLQRQASVDEPEPRGIALLRGVGFGLASLIVTGLAGGLGYGLVRGLRLTLSASTLAVGLGGMAFGALWLYMIVERRGWRWLWVSWGTIGLLIAGLLLLINLPGPLKTRVLESQQFRRLAQITEVESGTGKVRTLIWQGTVKLITSREPLVYPDGHKDRWAILRPLVGYGPESMYVAYNRFYPAELGHYESRSASPDRSHNETLDSLTVTGVLGFGAYLFTFLSVFAWGFHWLGLLRTRRDLALYLGLDLFFIVLLTFIGWRASGLYLFAVGVPLGILLGSMSYLTWQGLRAPGGEVAHPFALVLIAVVSGIFAHFIEINFGIAIASTRTMFWALSGVLMVSGLRWIETEHPVAAPQPAPAPSRSGRPPRRRGTSAPTSRPAPVAPSRTQAWLPATLALSLVLAFLLGTLCYDFINNPERLTNASDIFLKSFTWLYAQGRPAYGGLLIVFFPLLLGAFIGMGELDNEGRLGNSYTIWGVGLFLVLGIGLMAWLLYGSALASRQAAMSQVTVMSIAELVDLSRRFASTLGIYYMFMYLLWFNLGWVLSFEPIERPRAVAASPSLVVLGVGFVMGMLIVSSGSYNLIRADVLFKQGKAYAEQNEVNQKLIGIAHYEAALNLAPREDYYYLFLGKAFLEAIQLYPDSATRQALYPRTEEILKKAMQINPLNTDHSANLGRFYQAWGSSPEGAARREELLKLSEEYFRKALALSPQNPILWNQLATLKGIVMQDDAAFEELIARSMEVDERFEETWMMLGDWRASKGDYTGAAEAYERALTIRRNCTVYYVLGSLYLQQSAWFSATQRLQEGIDFCPTYGYLWDMYRLQAIGYSYAGMKAQALNAVEQAIRLAPTDQQATLQQLRAALEATP